MRNCCLWMKGRGIQMYLIFSLIMRAKTISSYTWLTLSIR
nr:MAG TPA: hypothetical protein [Caudoviricetes sp.]DAT27371.1 MAG TPA: hypothetical protein [Caudoviricetes sp.]